jgi:hypothetical protein
MPPEKDADRGVTSRWSLGTRRAVIERYVGAPDVE